MNNHLISNLRTLLIEAIHNANLLHDKLGDTKESYRQQFATIFATIDYCLTMIEDEEPNTEGAFTTSSQPAPVKPVDFADSMSYLLVNQDYHRYLLTDDDNTTRILWSANTEHAKRWIEENRTDLIGMPIVRVEIETWRETDIIIPQAQTGRDSSVLIPLSGLDNYLRSFDF